MFAMFEPITFPVTISDEFFKTENIEEINSGNEVPMDTIIIPIINGDNPKNIPIFSDASVNLSAAFINIAKLNINIPIQRIKLSIYLFYFVLLNYYRIY